MSKCSISSLMVGNKQLYFTFLENSLWMRGYNRKDLFLHPNLTLFARPSTRWTILHLVQRSRIVQEGLRNLPGGRAHRPGPRDTRERSPSRRTAGDNRSAPELISESTSRKTPDPTSRRRGAESRKKRIGSWCVLLPVSTWRNRLNAVAGKNRGKTNTIT